MLAARRSLAAAGTAATLAVEAATIAVLTALGREREFRVPLSQLDRWLHATPPADATVAVLRWAALLGAWWLLGSTLLYLAAAATRVPAAVRAVRWAALPPVRRLVDAAFVATVVGGAVLSPITARARDATPPPTTPVRDGRGRDVASLPPATAAPATPAPESSPTPGAAAPASGPVPTVQETGVLVAPGDDLWELSARRLAEAHGRARDEVADAEIAPYWVSVCARNRATLASGDPNLVFPGEVVVLPPVS